MTIFNSYVKLPESREFLDKPKSRNSHGDVLKILMGMNPIHIPLISTNPQYFQWPFQEPIDWRYLPYIKPILGLNFRGISPQNMAKHMVPTYLHFRIPLGPSWGPKDRTRIAEWSRAVVAQYLGGGSAKKGTGSLHNQIVGTDIVWPLDMI